MKKNASGANSVEAAQRIAIDALGFLAQDPERLGRFLALSGLGPDGIRAAAKEPGFLPGILDHIAGDEALLLSFASAAALDPTEVSRALAALSAEPPRS